MGGFSAIGAGNGWIISALGISVVFFGLASLAFIISYFPRAISWWNDHAQTPKHLFPLLKGLFKKRRRKEELLLDARGVQEPGEIDDAEEAFRLLTAHMGEPFELPRLIEMAEQRGLARVYSTINGLLVRGTIVGGADGLFRWGTATDSKKSVEGEEVK
ncbi:MAG: OadG family protein [Deltaproteobacteria bacterium]|nr:OadG family protein [Deltaproteobacteria bacterium]